MSREVRRVPATWEHPRYTEETAPRHNMVGAYIPLYEWSDQTQSQREWDKEVKQWEKGLYRKWDSAAKKDIWVEKPTEYRYMRYEDYNGKRPSYANRMPNWPEAERTHYQMYQTTSEGTPISPPMATPEELARWLVDNKASVFASQTATYEQWLCLCRKGWAPTAMVEVGEKSMRVMSGAAYLAEQEGKKNV